MRRVRTAQFLVLYRVIPSCHSWGFSPIAPSWGCPKGLKTKIWPNATFLRLRIVTGRKGANRGPESQQISCGAVPFRFADGGKESTIAKKLQESRDFCFHNGELCDHATKNGLSGWSARYFVSRETGRCVRIGFFGAVGALFGNIERQGCRCSPTSIEGAPFMEGV